MASFFYELFLFNSRRKLVFWGGLIVLILILAIQIRNIKFHENITDILPDDEELTQIETLFNNSGLNSNLIIHFYSSDSVSDVADEMIEISQSFDSAVAVQFPEYISQRMLEYPDSLVDLFYNHFLAYLPLYLTDDDYKSIDEKLTLQSINSTVEGNYRSLISPIGIFGSEMILKDPFGFVQIPLTNFRESQFDSNIQLYKNHLLSKDKRHLLYFLEIANLASETSRNTELVKGLDDLIEKYASDKIKIEYFGAPAVAVANAGRIKMDIALSVSLAIIIIFSLIVLYFRNVSTFFFILLPGIFGVLAALAIMSWISGSISLIALGVGSIMVGITVDFALHLFSHHRDEISMKDLFRSITQPILMSSGTTACAFFALIFIKSDAMRDLGLFVGISILCASFFSLIVLPHFLGVQFDRKAAVHEILQKLFIRISTYEANKKWGVLVLCLVISVVSLFYWNRISFNRDMMSLNYMPDYLANSEQHLNKTLSDTGKEMYIMASGSTLTQALEKGAEVNRRLSELKKESIINEYSSLNSLIPEVSLQEKRLKTWSEYWQKTDTALLNRTIESKASGVGFKPKAYPGLRAYLTNDYTPIGHDDLEQILSIVGSRYVVESNNEVFLLTHIRYNPDHKELLFSSLDKIAGVQMLDRSHITNKLIDVLSKDFNTLIGLSLVIVFAILLLIYGRIELALITILPIGIGWLWTLGIMGFFGLSFNIVNVIICSLIFGLGVDYSIFYMRGLTQKYKIGIDNKSTFKISIILSAITTLVGIGVLIFAKHPALKSIALLAIIGISSVLFLTFYIQEALFNLFIQGRKDRGLIPFTFLSFLKSMFSFLFFGVGCVILMLVRIAFFIPLAPKTQKIMYHQLIMWYCRSLIYIMLKENRKINSKDVKRLEDPSIIISNHHSFLDILLLLQLSPQLVMVTNDWVYNSPFFGMVVRYADFILASKGVENQMDKINSLVKGGYSIIVFPEGTRSETINCGRFHKGAFYLAEKFDLDIQPIVLHGTHYAMPKKDGFYLRNNDVDMKFLNRISISNTEYGIGYRERTKRIGRYFKEEYNKFRAEKEGPSYFLDTLQKNFILKGPILEWYMRIKLKLENNYQLFHEILPARGTIVDVGCGYGFLGYSLTIGKASRQVIGIDYDVNKIEVAKNCAVKPENLHFVHGDIMKYPYPEANAFVLSDVLHYLERAEQTTLLDTLIERLKPGGIIFVREGDKMKERRHLGTTLSEVFSTKSGFNKSRNRLNYISEEWLREKAAEHSLDYSSIDNTKWTSNTISLMKKPHND